MPLAPSDSDLFLQMRQQGRDIEDVDSGAEGHYEPRDPFGPSLSDRDLDRARRKTPGMIIYDEPPLEDSSNANAVIQGDQTQEICRVKYAGCQALTAVVRVMPPQSGSFAVASGGGNVTAVDATDPFNQPTSQGIVLPATLQQMVEVIGYMKASHQNSSLILPFNMPLGQFLRLQTAGSRLDVWAKLTSRYYPKLGGPTIFSWLEPPTGSNFKRNVAFDNPPSLSAFIAGNPIPLQVQGFCGKAFTAPCPVTRIFYGWTDAALAAGAIHLCPVPTGAQTVLLKCDGSNDTFAGTQPPGIRHCFFEVCQSQLGTFRPILNQPSNTTVRLSSDCTAIAVVNIDATLAGNTPRWELIYDLGM